MGPLRLRCCWERLYGTSPDGEFHRSLRDTHQHQAMYRILYEHVHATGRRTMPSAPSLLVCSISFSSTE